MGLLFSFLGIGNRLEAYSISVFNTTSRTVKVKINYQGETGFSCRPDSKKLVAGGHVYLQSYGCLIKNVEAEVYLKRRRATRWGSRRRTFKLQTYMPSDLDHRNGVTIYIKPTMKGRELGEEDPRTYYISVDPHGFIRKFQS